MRYVAGLQSLNGPGIALSEEDRKEVADALDGALKGCMMNGVHVDAMYRFNLDESSSCSLAVTVAVGNSGFGVYP